MTGRKTEGNQKANVKSKADTAVLERRLGNGHAVEKTFGRYRLH